MKKEPTLYPVILSVPADARGLRPRDLVIYLSRHARTALKLSAEKSHLEMSEPLKDKGGRPMSTNGVYWSLTHKPDYVAAVVARQPIGIDVEKIAGRKTKVIFNKVADPDEWALVGGRSWEGFHRYWTAKEAVLKAEGTGLKALSHCRVIAVLDGFNLLVQVGDRKMTVEHHYFDNHIASVAKIDENVCWAVVHLPRGSA
jgi:4'-phosphopantetheinyl transferase